MRTEDNPFGKKQAGIKDWAGTAIRTVGSNPTLSAMPY